jgi:hypothetical protein
MYPEDKIDFIEVTTTKAMKLYEFLYKNPDRQTNELYEELSKHYTAIIAAIDEHYKFLDSEGIDVGESYLTAWLYDKYDMSEKLEEIRYCIETWEKSKMPVESSQTQ